MVVMVGLVAPGVRVLVLALVVLAGCGPPPVGPGEMLTPPESCDVESDGTFEAMELYGSFSDLPLRDGDPVAPLMVGPIPHIVLRVAFEGPVGDLSCVRTTFEGDYAAEHILRTVSGVTDLRSDRIRMPASGEGEFRLVVTARGRTIERTLVLSTDTTPPPAVLRIETPAYLTASEQNVLRVHLSRAPSATTTVVLDADRPFFASPSPLVDVLHGTSSATVEVRVNEPGPIRFEAWVLGREESPVGVDVDVIEAEPLDFEITPNDLEVGSTGWPVRVELRIAEPLSVDVPFSVAGTSISGLITAGSTLGFLDVVRGTTGEPLATRVVRVTPAHAEYRGAATLTMRPPAPRSPRAGDLAFNEIHANPTEDMNCDGRVDAWDQYVELVNVSADHLDLIEMTINGARFYSPVLGPHDGVILFAGPLDLRGAGLPHCAELDWGSLYRIAVGDAEEFVMDTSVSLGLSGRVIASATWDPASLSPGESLQRTQDLLTFFGEAPAPAWMPHSALHPTGDLFSPGLPYAERLP